MQHAFTWLALQALVLAQRTKRTVASFGMSS